jgi:serine/threonine protein kinase
MSGSNSTKIADRFEVRRPIGSGGRGTVYLAFDSILLNHVAIKVLNKVNRDETIVRFQQEAKATGKLQHRCIARALDFGIADGALYLVMEFVEGDSLAQVLEREKVLSLHRALPLFIDICSALAHAHSQGILHRDLKPANVIIAKTDEGEEYAKLVDFGIAIMIDEGQRLTDPNAIVGSPAYMSPEQAATKPVDERTDIYSLGCLMFETLAGHPPILGDTAIGTISRKLAEPAPSLKDTLQSRKNPINNEETLDQIANCVDTCLRMEADKRFRNVVAVQQALESIDVSPPPPPPVETVSTEKKPFFTTARCLIAGGFITLIVAVILIASSVIQASLVKDRKLATLPVEVLDEALKPVKRKYIETNSNSDSDKIANSGRVGDMFMLDMQRDLNVKVNTGINSPTFREVPSNPGIFRASSAVSDDDLLRISSRKGIKRLYFERAGFISANGLKPLAKMNLEGLVFNYTHLSDDAVEVISDFKTLHTLRFLMADRITDNGLKVISKMNNLDDVRIASCSITDAGVDYLTRLPSLDFLGVSGSTLVTDKSVPFINRRRIEELELSRTAVSAQGISRILVNQPKLRSLALRGANLNDEVFVAITKLPLLTELMLEYSRAEDRDMQILSRKKLSYLQVSADTLSEKGISCFADKQFDRLTFQGLKVTKPVLQSLMSLNTRCLELSRPVMLFDDHLPRLAGIKSLEMLKLCDLNRAQVTRAGLARFQREFLQRNKKECVLDYDFEGEE